MNRYIYWSRKQNWRLLFIRSPSNMDSKLIANTFSIYLPNGGLEVNRSIHIRYKFNMSMKTNKFYRIIIEKIRCGIYWFTWEMIDTLYHQI